MTQAAKTKRHTATDQVNRFIMESLESTGDHQVAKPKEPEMLRTLTRNLNKVVMLPVHLLVVEDNIRKDVDTQSPEFLALVDSVKVNGVQQSIIVDIQRSGNADFRLVVLAGQRRFLAAKQAGLESIAGLILQTNARADRLAVGLAENILRENLHVLDLAEAYLALLDEGWNEADIGDRFERGKKTVQHYLRLARWPVSAKDLIRQHRSKFNSFVLFNRFLSRKWESDDSLLAALKKFVDVTPVKRPATQLNRHGTKLKASLNRREGLKCTVKGTDEAGQITIKYSSETSLVELLRLLCSGEGEGEVTNPTEGENRE